MIKIIDTDKLNYHKVGHFEGANGYVLMISKSELERAQSTLDIPEEVHNLLFEDNQAFIVTPVENGLYKKELLATREIFRECFRRWILEEQP